MWPNPIFAKIRALHTFMYCGKGLSKKIGAAFAIFNRPIGENSPNLVTLHVFYKESISMSIRCQGQKKFHF
jgi:hypothetical protein